MADPASPTGQPATMPETTPATMPIVAYRQGSYRQVPALVDAAAKTGNQRVVRLDAQTVTAIRDLWSMSEVWGPWLLTPYDRLLNPDRLKSWWRLARRPAGLDAPWRLHDLRHWSGTEAIGRGHDIRPWPEGWDTPTRP
jgi:integrase